MEHFRGTGPDSQYNNCECYGNEAEKQEYNLSLELECLYGKVGCLLTDLISGKVGRIDVPEAICEEASELYTYRRSAGLSSNQLFEAVSTDHISNSIHCIPGTKSHRLFMPTVPHLRHCNECRSLVLVSCHILPSSEFFRWITYLYQPQRHRGKACKLVVQGNCGQPAYTTKPLPSRKLKLPETSQGAF